MMTTPRQVASVPRTCRGAARDGSGPMQLIVMYESRTWRVRPGAVFTFGRASTCCAVLPAVDHGLSRNAGSIRYHDGSWWLHNDSTSAALCVLGDRGFRVDLPQDSRYRCSNGTPRYS